jgi:thiamine biosynthesis lipoprotein
LADSVARAKRSTIVQQKSGFLQCTFVAMGSPCELLLDTHDEALGERLSNIVAAEAWRIEDKFSRYLPGNAIEQINSADGTAVTLDDEMANLVDFSASLFELSAGRFDITSGVLREVWNFDGSDKIPDQESIAEVLRNVGWNKAAWRRPSLTLKPGMQIDLGGIGKEYAVDKAAGILQDQSEVAALVNFGGDIFATGSPDSQHGWQVGVEALDADAGQAKRLIRLTRGGLATSGDARRFLLKDGVRYSHILDPSTGWPVGDAPRSITVAADTCTQAGMLATLAMLRGSDAEEFLQQQDYQFWIFR